MAARIGTAFPVLQTTGVEMIWFDLDLETIADYEIWKPESLAWALGVNWALVNDMVRNDLSRFPTDDFDRAMRNARTVLSVQDRWGFASLYAEPIYATPLQISGGGHRITAMKAQGVRWALGQCVPDDIGVSVDPIHAYGPLR